MNLKNIKQLIEYDPIRNNIDIINQYIKDFNFNKFIDFSDENIFDMYMSDLPSRYFVYIGNNNYVEIYRSYISTHKIDVYNIVDIKCNPIDIEDYYSNLIDEKIELTYHSYKKIKTI